LLRPPFKKRREEHAFAMSLKKKDDSAVSPSQLHTNFWDPNEEEKEKRREKKKRK